MGSRWLPRGRHVLRPLGLSDHEPAPGRVHPCTPDRPSRLLGATGSAPPPRALRRARCDRGVRRVVGTRGGAEATTGRRPGRPPLLGELAVHPGPPLVLRPVRCAVARRAHLVAGDRRAVLPGVAPRGRCVLGARPGPASATRRFRDGRRGRVSSADGVARRFRPDPRLLRQRHARALASRRHLARDAPGAPATRCGGR